MSENVLEKIIKKKINIIDLLKKYQFKNIQKYRLIKAFKFKEWKDFSSFKEDNNLNDLR